MQVDNRIASFFWNNFDFLIRMGYCKTGPIGKMVNDRLFWNLYSSDFRELDRRFEESASLLKKHGITIRDKVVLEIGPGNCYINAYNFLMCGAKKVILIDKFPRINKTEKQKQYSKLEREYISKKYNRPLFFINSQVNGKRIEFIEGDIIRTDVEEVDFIFTNSVLEHIKPIEETIKKMSSILKPDGYILHNIDLRDHYNFNEPFLFYKYPEWVWKNLLTKEGLSYTNRLRYGDFVRLFKENGLRIVAEKRRGKKLKSVRLCNKFSGKGKEDLETVYLSVLLEKLSYDEVSRE